MWSTKVREGYPSLSSWRIGRTVVFISERGIRVFPPGKWEET